MDISKLPENELIERSLAGDNRAFEVLFDRYKDNIRELIRKRSRGGSDINDLLQETFIKAYLNLGKYDKSYTFGQWLYAIARNTFIDFTRRQETKNNLLSIDENIGHELSRNSPEDIVIDKEKSEEIGRDIARLAPQYRRIIELRYYRELSYEEIAIELGIPLGTVKTNLYRAKEKLIKIIRDR